MFDTHCHLNYEVYENTVGTTILEARNTGIRYILIPGTDLESSKKAVQIAGDYKNTYAACGIHPTEDLENMDIEGNIYKLQELIRYSENVQAVGEIGLDYYKFKSAPRVQKMFLVEQIKMAKKFNKAIIFHNRHAADELIFILNKNWNRSLEYRCVFHCAEANETLLKFAKDKRIYLGFDGDITYDLVKQNFIKQVPLDLIVLETDSPNLTPEPARNEVRYPNTPKNLIYIAEKVSQLKDISIDKVIETTTRNAMTLFLISL